MHTTVEATFKKFLKTDLHKIKRYESTIILSNDTEALHQMRVSIRRMRSVIFIFKTAITTKTAKDIYTSLSDIASYFDRARDIDVYIETFLKKEQLTPIELQIYKIATKQRKDEYKKIKRFLRSKKYMKIMKKFKLWLKDRGYRIGLTKEQLCILKEEVTRYALNRLQKYNAKIVSQGNILENNWEDEQAHRLRIKLKKMRYAVELFTPYFKKELEYFKKILKELQDILGIIHDIYVIRELHKAFLHSNKHKELKDYTKKIEMYGITKKEKLKEEFFLKWALYKQCELPNQ